MESALTSREMTWPEAGSRVRIFALDGGGIKGVFTAGVLAELERATGRRVAEHFDLITGTSTGGILAIGLGLGLSAEGLVDMYVANGGRIFGSGRLASVLAGKAARLFGPRHSPAGLRSVLSKALGNTRLGDSSQRLVIPTFDALKGHACTFKTAHHPRAINEYQMSAVDVALATSAAPSFFRAAVPLGREGASYMDGGLWANSPALVGIVEAVHFLGARLDDVHVLSIGTTEEYSSFMAQRSAGLLRWSNRIVDAMMAAQVSGSQAQAGLLIGDRLLRVNFQANRGEYVLDDARPDTIARLAELGRSVARAHDMCSAVEAAFLDGRPAAPFVPLRHP